MPPGNIQEWLAMTQRKALVAAASYAAVAIAGGVLAMALTFWVVFLAVKLFLLVFVPTAHLANACSIVIAMSLTIVAWVDSARANRDEMSPIVLWLAREYLEIGPRVVRDGLANAARARRLARLDIETCAKFLSHLAFKSAPTTQAELLKSFPDLNWASLVEQLRLLHGVIVFKSGPPRIILTTPLRLELRRFLVRSKDTVPEPEEPREQVPVQEPQKLEPCELLGVSASASVGEIKSAYRTRVKECHPDRFAGMDEHSRQLAEEWTKALNAAYETLLAEHDRRRV